MNRMTVVLAPGILMLAAAPVVPAGAQSSPEPVRTGDSEMSCAALAAEINALPNQSAKPPKKKNGGLGLLRALSAVSPLGGAVGGAGGALAGSALSAAGSIAASEARDSDRTHTAGSERPSTSEQRRQWLTDIRKSKKC